MLKRVWSHAEEMECNLVLAHFGSLSPSARSEQITHSANNSHRSNILLLAHNLLKSGSGK
jgi:hypothetical protein